MPIDNAALRYWNASRILLDPTSDEGDALNATCQLTLMAHGSNAAIARQASKTLALADKLGLTDFDFALEA